MWTWLEAESGLNTTASWLVLTFLLGLLVWRLLRGRSAAGADLPPGPYCLPFLGYLPWIDSKAPYETFAKLSQRYGKIYSLKLGDMLAVFITDPELVRQAFSRDVFSGRAPLYLTHGIMKGHGENHSRHLDTSNDNNSISTYSGLICAEGEAWREHRKFVMNVMKQLGMAGRQGASLMESRVMDRVLEFVQVVYSPSSFFIIELVTIFVDFRKGLKESSPSSSDGVDLVPGLRHCIGNIINGVVFGRTYAADDPTWIWLQHLLDEGVKQVAVAGPINFLPVLRLPPTRQRISNFTYFNLVRWNFFRFLPRYRNIMSFILDGQSQTHRHYQEIIDNHQLPDNQGHSSLLPSPVIWYVNCCPSVCYLPVCVEYSDVIEAYLIEMERRRSKDQVPGTFTVNQLYHVLADMFGAGTDTALTTIKWIVLYTILYPDVQVSSTTAALFLPFFLFRLLAC